jgi:hypothetical protein
MLQKFVTSSRPKTCTNLFFNRNNVERLRQSKTLCHVKL